MVTSFTGKRRGEQDATMKIFPAISPIAPPLLIPAQTDFARVQCRHHRFLA